MTLTAERNITTKLLIDDLDMWDEFDIKKSRDPQTNIYYTEIINLIDQQIRTGVNWLDTDDARDYFYGESKYSQEVFGALEDEWDDILEEYYANINELIETIYEKGKQKGYSDIRQRIRFTETDRLALAFAKEYNFDLITNLDDDVRNQIKNVITKGVIAGEHPSKIAPQILNIAEEQLEESIFTPKQRATLIARTETSRVQNTGILQTYVNEGYTEVKILTAEDNNVCYTCLKYAFEFNEDAEVTLENRGEERIHNIHELIKGESFPPFHPLCRCTYLSVWKSKGQPPENPAVVKLVSRKAIKQIQEKVQKIKIRRQERHLKTPEKTAEYFGLEYHGLRGIDNNIYHKFYDSKFDCSFYIAKEFTEGTEKLISLTNGGDCLHDLKDILRTYSESLPLMKKNTKSIRFCNFNNPDGNLGVNVHYPSSSQWYGQNFVDIYESAVSAPLNTSSNVHMSLLHELSHSVDINSIRGLYISKMSEYKYAISKDGMNRCSIHVNSRDDTIEDVAEALAMIAFKNMSNKEFAIIAVPVAPYGNLDFINMNYWEFIDKFKHRVEVLEHLLNL